MEECSQRSSSLNSVVEVGFSAELDFNFACYLDRLVVLRDFEDEYCDLRRRDGRA